MLTIFREFENLGLALPELEHAPFMCACVNNPEITQYLMPSRPITLTEEEDFIRNCTNTRTDIVFLVVLKEDSEWKPIGVMSIHRIDHFNQSATTGAWFAKEYQNKGYGVKVKYHLLKYAFDWLHLRTMTTTVYGANERSLKYNERCGYEVRGVHPAYKWHAGKWHDEVILGLTSERFAKLWEFYEREKHIPSREEVKGLVN